ncbi:HIT family protein [Pseudonocardia acaciae]|uniref:HIT family protein n=1 Tax=Pseudonocardia acaciae TaxID=551276 RepID=UPI0006869068|nr:HIT family protein [Pseudonocardia acaciae]
MTTPPDDALITELYDRLDATARGEADNLIAELRSGYAVLADDQSLPGRCLLLHRDRVEHPDDLSDPRRAEFWLDVSLLGEAVRAAASAFDPAFRRINYEVLGNTWPHLHAHVHARYTWEPEEYRYLPIWRYRPEDRPPPPPPARQAELRATITAHLRAATARAYKTPGQNP